MKQSKFIFKVVLSLLITLLLGFVFSSDAKNVDADNVTYDGITFDKVLDSSNAGGTLEPGNYYLTSNVSLSSSIKCSGNLNIHLNGFVLSLPGTNSTAITISVTGNFGLYDHSTNNTVRYFTGSLTNGFTTLVEGEYDTTGKTLGTDYVTSTGGVLFAVLKNGVNSGAITATGDITFKNVDFAGNLVSTGDYVNSIVRVNSETSNIVIDGCNFIGASIRTSNGALINVLNAASISISNISVQYEYNYNDKSDTFLYVTNSATSLTSMDVTNSTFSNNVGLGLFRIRSSSAAVKFDNCTFNKNNYHYSSNVPGFITFDSLPSLTVKDSTFSNCWGDTAYSLLYGSATSILLDNTKFDTNSTYHYAACLYVTNNSQTGTSVTIKGKKDNNNSIFYKNSSYSNGTYTNNNGGAIYLRNVETVSITDTVFDSNKAECSTSNYRSGGAMAFTQCANITIDDSTFTNNVCNNQGGALYVEAPTKLDITDTTFTSNSSYSYGGAIYTSGGAVTLDNVTATSNKSVNGYGGFLFCKPTESHKANSSLTIKGSVQDSKSIFKSNEAYGHGGAVYADYMPSVSIVNTTFTENNSKQTSQSYGGSALYIAALDSVTIDKTTFSKNTSSCSGTVYFNRVADATISNTTFTENTSSVNGACFYINNATPSEQTTTFDKCTFTSNALNNNLGYGGAVYACNSNAISFDECTFTSNKAKYYGGAAYIANLSSASFTECTFTSNEGSLRGGAIYMTSTTTLTIDDSEFTSNVCTSSGESGGAMYLYSVSSTTITDSEFTSNSTKGSGGAIYDYAPSNEITLTIKDTTFTSNSIDYANGYGGAIYMTRGALVLDSVTATGNHSNGKVGGFLYYDGGNSATETRTVEIKGTQENNKSVYTSNYTTGIAYSDSNCGGGAIFLNAPYKVDITYTDFIENSTASNAGALLIQSSNTVNIKNSNFNDNTTSKYYGGAVRLNTVANATIQDCAFDGNKQTSTAYNDYQAEGGALFIGQSTTSVTLIKDTTFTNNSAPWGGGALYHNKGTLTLDNVTGTSNTSANGGFLYYLGGNDNNNNIIIKGTDDDNNKSIYSQNAASSNGGVIYTQNAKSITIKDSEFNDNKLTQVLSTTSVYGSIFCIKSDYETTVSINDSKFNGNNSLYDDNYNSYRVGGIYAQKSNITIEDSKFKSNSTAGHGTIYVQYSTLKLKKTTFENNTSNTYAGCIFGNGANLEIDSCLFKNNSCKKYGGAIYATNGSDRTFVIKSTDLENKTTFTGNHTAACGGALYLDNYASVSISDAIFDSNYIDQQYDPTYKGSYPAICMYQITTTTVTNTDITNNINYYSDDDLNIYREGVCYIGNTNLTMKDCNISNNKTGEYSGLHLFSCTVAFEGNIKINNNKAIGDYGALYASDTTIDTRNDNLTLLEIKGNEAKGHAVYSYTNDLYLKKCKIEDNVTQEDGPIGVGSNVNIYLYGTASISGNKIGTGDDLKLLDFSLSTSSKFVFDATDTLKENAKYYFYTYNTTSSFADSNVLERYKKQFVYQETGSYTIIYNSNSLYIHQHSWNVTESFNKITLSCYSESDVSYSLTVNYDTRYYYNDSNACVNASVTLTDPNSYAIPYKVMYLGRGGTTYALSETAPTEVGHYFLIVQYDANDSYAKCYYSFDIVDNKTLMVNGVDLSNGGYLANGATTVVNTEPSNTGYVYYDKANNVLTLNNAVINKGSFCDAKSYSYLYYGQYLSIESGIFADYDLTIKLVGENKITTDNYVTPNKNNYYENVGNLKAYKFKSAIMGFESVLTFETDNNGKLIINGSNNPFTFGIAAFNGDLVFNSGDYEINGAENALMNNTLFEGVGEEVSKYYINYGSTVQSANYLPKPSNKSCGFIKINSGNFKFDGSSINKASAFAWLSNDIIIGNDQYQTKPNLDVFATYIVNTDVSFASIKIEGSHNFSTDATYPFFVDSFYEDANKKSVFTVSNLKYYGDFEITDGVITKVSIPVQISYNNSSIDVSKYYLIPYESNFGLKQIKDLLFEKGYVLNKFAFGQDYIDYNNNVVTFDSNIVDTSVYGAKLFNLNVSSTPFVSEVAKYSNDYEFTVDVPEYEEEGKSIEYKWYTTKTGLDILPSTKYSLYEGNNALAAIDNDNWITSQREFHYNYENIFYYAIIPNGFVGKIYLESSVDKDSLGGTFTVSYTSVNPFVYDETLDRYVVDVSSIGYIVFNASSAQVQAPKIRLYAETTVKDELIANCSTKKYTGEEIVGDKILIVDIFFKTGDTVDLEYTYQVKYGFLHKHGEEVIDKELKQADLANLDYDNDASAYILAGNYYLNSDIVLNGNLIVPEGKTAYICLNSHKIDLKNYKILVYGTLTIDECHEEVADLGSILSTDTYGGVELYSDSIFNFNNGKFECTKLTTFITVKGTDVEININDGLFNLTNTNNSYSYFISSYGDSLPTFTLNIYDGTFSSTNQRGSLIYFEELNPLKKSKINIVKATFNNLNYGVYASFNSSYDGTKTDIYFGDVQANGCYKFTIIEISQKATINIECKDIEFNNVDYGFYFSESSEVSINFHIEKAEVNESEDYFIYCDGFYNSNFNLYIEDISGVDDYYILYFYRLDNSTSIIDIDNADFNNTELVFEAYYVVGGTLDVNIYSGNLIDSNELYICYIYGNAVVNINFYDTIIKFLDEDSTDGYTLYFYYVYENSKLNINLSDYESTNVYCHLYFEKVYDSSEVVVNMDDVKIVNCYYNFYFDYGVYNAKFTINLYNAIISNCHYNMYCDLYTGALYTLNMYEGCIDNCYYGMYTDTSESYIKANYYGGEIKDNHIVYVYGDSDGESNVVNTIGGSFKSDYLYFYPNYGIDFVIGEGKYAVDGMDVTINTDGSYGDYLFSYKDTSLVNYIKIDDGYLVYEYDSDSQLYKYYSRSSETISISLVPQVYLFDNEAKAFNIVNSSLSGFTVKYYQNDEEVTNPTAKGKYKVVITREAGQGFEAYSETIEDGLQIKEANTISDFTITDYLEEGTLVVSAKSLSDSTGASIVYKYARTIDGEYSLHMPTRPGTYFCKAISESTDEYISSSEIKQFVIAHNYDFWKFVWDEANKTCKAVYRCFCHKKDNHDATVTNEITLQPTTKTTGIKTYTATYEGHTSTLNEVLPVFVCTHDYQFTKFIWDEVNHTAKAVYTCSVDACGDVKKYTATITNEITVAQTCDGKGTRTYTATYDGHTSTLNEELAALGHDYEFVNITWTDYTAKANYKCSHDESHVQSYDCEVTNQVTLASTCSAKGKKLYTATYDGHTDTKEQELAMLPHPYEFTKFVWADDFTAKALYTCPDCNATTEYTATVTSQVTLAATCVATGKKLYTATYEGHTATKEDTLAALGHDYSLSSPVWSSDNKSCTVSYTCLHDQSHTGSANGVVTMSISDNKIVYTAVFNVSGVTIPNAVKEVAEEKGDIQVKNNEDSTPSVNISNVELINGSLSSLINVVVSDSIGDIEKAVNSNLKANSETKKSKLVATFDIHLVNQDGQTVENIDGNKYRVSVDIPEQYLKMKNLRIVYINDNNEVETYDSVVLNGVIIFETTHFSNWGIIGEDSGLPWWAVMLIVILVLIIIFIGLFFVWKWEQKKEKDNDYKRILSFLDPLYLPIDRLLFK